LWRRNRECYHPEIVAAATRIGEWEDGMAQRDPEGERAQENPAERIKVTDRRHFTSTGERRAEIEEVEEAPRAVRVDPVPEAAGQERRPGFERRTAAEPDEVDFAMLVNAMAQPALLFLGEIPHPATQKTSVDLEQAKLQIDMLEVLAAKSRGNLTPPEERLLDRWLYELRMRYVARTTGTG
jgi:hypothetical protein